MQSASAYLHTLLGPSGAEYGTVWDMYAAHAIMAGLMTCAAAESVDAAAIAAKAAEVADQMLAERGKRKRPW